MHSLDLGLHMNVRKWCAHAPWAGAQCSACVCARVRAPKSGARGNCTVPPHCRVHDRRISLRPLFDTPPPHSLSLLIAAETN